MNNWPDITRATNAQILAWAEAQPWVRAMAACQQDAQWHAEGDVWTHTRMVSAELERFADWPSLNRAAQLKLLLSAVPRRRHADCPHEPGQTAGAGAPERLRLTRGWLT